MLHGYHSLCTSKQGRKFYFWYSVAHVLELYFWYSVAHVLELYGQLVVFIVGTCFFKLYTESTIKPMSKICT